MKKQFIMTLLSLMLLFSCSKQQSEPADTESIESLKAQLKIEIDDPAALDVIDSNAVIEILAEGFYWSEGPLWVEQLESVIFSDVPANKIYMWNEHSDLSVYLHPSGFTGNDSTNPGEGSNGLLLDPKNRLILCQHGDQRIARMNAPVTDPRPDFITIAAMYNGKKFNSPNDLVMDREGNIYFTDPPYGRPGTKTGEAGINGVYRVDPTGKVTLLIDSLNRPNGIGLSPDEKTLYVNQSDPDKPYLYSYLIEDDGTLTNGMILFDFSEAAKSGKGLPDGLKVHSSGHIFATGPGGVHIISPEGKRLALIRTVKATANCAFDKNETYLYMTTTNLLMRVKLK